MECYWVILTAIIVFSGSPIHAQPYDTCPSPPVIANGDYLPVEQVSDGAVVVYTCDEGYNINGTRTATCTISDDRNTYSYVPYQSTGGFPPNCKYNPYRDREFRSANTFDDLPQWMEETMGASIGIMLFLFLILLILVALAIYCIYKRKKHNPADDLPEWRQRQSYRRNDDMVFTDPDGYPTSGNGFSPNKGYAPY